MAFTGFSEIAALKKPQNNRVKISRGEARLTGGCRWKSGLIQNNLQEHLYKVFLTKDDE